MEWIWTTITATTATTTRHVRATMTMALAGKGCATNSAVFPTKAVSKIVDDAYLQAALWADAASLVPSCKIQSKCASVSECVFVGMCEYYYMIYDVRQSKCVSF